jgi:hypothetical protein
MRQYEPLYVNKPHAQKSHPHPPHILYMTYRGPLWETLLDLGNDLLNRSP